VGSQGGGGKGGCAVLDDEARSAPTRGSAALQFRATPIESLLVEIWQIFEKKNIGGQSRWWTTPVH